MSGERKDNLRIRKRERRGRVKENGWMHTTWTEWQVVRGRTIIARFEIPGAAEKYIARLAQGPSP